MVRIVVQSQLHEQNGRILKWPGLIRVVVEPFYFDHISADQKNNGSNKCQRW